MASRPAPATPGGVTPGEVRIVTQTYIGVSGGYLGDFNQNELSQFLSRLDIDVDVYGMEGTTREKFIDVLLMSPRPIQARILRAVVDRCPVGDAHAPDSRTPKQRRWILDLADRCDGHMVVASVPADASETVARAMADAETLLGTAGAMSALDRVHTALHGYLRAACEAAGIEFRSEDPSMSALWSELRRNHPRLAPSGPRSEDIEKMQRSLGAIIDVLSPLQNRATLAHANDELLGDNEARLALNAAMTALSYLESKLRG